LIIEDDESVRLSLADMLALNNFDVLTRDNGRDGLAAAQTETPTIIITDVAMPGMTGFELLERFRSDPNLRTVPVIVISASKDRSITRRGMELGAADFITKPFTEEEVLRSLAARLEKLDLLNELDAFAHTVAHDLKNPLGTLDGRLHLLGEKVGQADTATLRRDIATAQKSTRQMNEIIEELLILAGVRKQVVTPEPLDMHAIVAQAVDREDILLRQHSAQIVLPATWPSAYGHTPWITQIWVNYLSNAAKYGGPSPRITLGGETTADGRHARFWVQDRGPGLDEAARAMLFVPFSRISTVRARGHGLGLSIVRRIAEKLDGHVGVDSTPGAGARFWFEVPNSLRTSSNSSFTLTP
jgi:signal transduction histidine kinase